MTLLTALEASGGAAALIVGAVSADVSFLSTSEARARSTAVTTLVVGAVSADMTLLTALEACASTSRAVTSVRAVSADVSFLTALEAASTVRTTFRTASSVRGLLETDVSSIELSTVEFGQGSVTIFFVGKVNEAKSKKQLCQFE